MDNTVTLFLNLLSRIFVTIGFKGFKKNEYLTAKKEEKFQWYLAGDDVDYQKLMNVYYKKQEVEYHKSVIDLRTRKIELYDQDVYKEKISTKKKYRSTSLYDIKVVPFNSLINKF